MTYKQPQTRQKKERLSIYKKAVKGQAEVEEEATTYRQSTLLIQTRSERKTCILSTNLFHIAHMNPDARSGTDNEPIMPSNILSENVTYCRS